MSERLTDARLAEIRQWASQHPGITRAAERARWPKIKAARAARRALALSEPQR